MSSNNFFIQLIVRFFSANPKFFKWVQLAALILTAVSAGLNALPADSVPPFIGVLKSNVVWISGIVTMILAQLPNKTTP